MTAQKPLYCLAQPLMRALSEHPIRLRATGTGALRADLYWLQKIVASARQGQLRLANIPQMVTFIQPNGEPTLAIPYSPRLEQFRDAINETSDAWGLPFSASFVRSEPTYQGERSHWSIVIWSHSSPSA